MATNDTPQPLSAAELRGLANEAEAREGGSATAVSAVVPQPPLQGAAIMLSPADLKELLSLKDQLDALKKDLADKGKIAAAAGDPICYCKGCHPDNIVAVGAQGYKETKNPETGELLPYMPPGQHAA